MTLSVCPSAVCHAPAERVWPLLADPQRYGAWSRARVDAVEPPGLARAGQRILLRAPRRGGWFAVRLDIDGADPLLHVLELRAAFPLGIRLRSRIAVSPIDHARSLVQYG